ncbi:MAG: recombinase family protein [Oscillospiraceae bacterium]|jgi:DNA invertase Pin-like site-specific DNA recombinase|nr:recombinase family protein [Oscillospiraceae bacterium]
MLIQLIDRHKCKLADYLRISREDGDDLESDSISNQRDILKDFAFKNKLCVVEEYVDDGWTGTNFERPGFKRMMEDVKNKKINFIITKDLSRLGRDHVKTGEYVETIFPESHIRYVSILDGIDTGIDCAANDMIPFRLMMNDVYARDISKKIKIVIHQKKSQGLFVGTKAPYGYKKFEKHKLIIDKPAAEVVRRIFDMAIKGTSYNSIAHILSLEGIPNPSGYANYHRGNGLYNDCWSFGIVKKILKNRVYSGDMVQGKERKINFKSKKRIRIPEDKFIVVENTHEPIISKEDFQVAQLFVKSRECSRQVKHNFLLKSLVFCADCRGIMSLSARRFNDKGKIYEYLTCNNYRRFPDLKRCTSHLIRLDVLTETVIEEIKLFCKKFKAIKYDSEDQEKIKKEIDSLKFQIENINFKIDKIYEDELSGHISSDLFSRMGSKFEKSKEILKAKLETLKNSSVSKQQNYLNTKEAVQNFLNSSECNREMIMSLVERIEVGKNKEVAVVFRYT